MGRVVDGPVETCGSGPPAHALGLVLPRVLARLGIGPVRVLLLLLSTTVVPVARTQRTALGLAEDGRRAIAPGRRPSLERLGRLLVAIGVAEPRRTPQKPLGLAEVVLPQLDISSS